MIARIWRCTLAQENVSAYLHYFEASVLPRVSRIDGFSHVSVLEQKADGDAELTLVSFWVTMDAIRAFAGDDPEAAVVPPAMQAMLKRFETRVTHHAVLLQAGPDAPAPALPD